jgi:hypothetical protein
VISIWRRQKRRAACLVLANAFFIVALTAFVRSAHSIEISLCPPEHFKNVEIESDFFPRCGGTIWVSGGFVAGDYEKFRDFVEANLRRIMLGRGTMRSVTFIASGGDDAAAAMNIGRLIRRLQFTPEIGFMIDASSINLRFSGGFISTDHGMGRCAAACLYAWGGGILRGGNHFLVPSVLDRGDHRLRAEIIAYFSEVNLPIELADLQGHIGYYKDKPLPKRYVFSYLNRFAHTKDEYCVYRGLDLCTNLKARLEIEAAIEREFKVKF